MLKARPMIAQLGAAVLFTAGGAFSFAAPTPNSVHVTNGAAEVNVQTQLWTEEPEITEAKLQETARRWEKITAEIWNQEPVGAEKAPAVHFIFHFSARAKAEKADPAFHQIEVIVGGPNSIGRYSAYVARGENPFGPHEGVFPIQIFDETLAHETGHLMNLEDEYLDFTTKEEVPSSVTMNGRVVVPALVENPVPGIWNAYFAPAGESLGIMSDRSTVIKTYYLNEILRRLGTRDRFSFQSR